MAIISRLKTIIGNDATFFSGLSRLFFYAKVSNPLKKISQKFSPTQTDLELPIVYKTEAQKQLWQIVIKNKQQEKAVVEAFINKLQIEAKLLTSGANNFLFQLEPTAKPLVSIIIPTKNRAELVKQCIDAVIEKTTYKNIEIILVDNQSNEPALAKLIGAYKENKSVPFKHIQADFAFNFSALINLGTKNAQGEYLVLLNNDTEIITPNWIEYMLGFAQQADVGAVGCKLLYPNKTVQHAGVVLTNDTISKHIHVGKSKEDEEVNEIKIFPAVTAACLMVSKQKMLQVGGFDEQFNVEYNDIDFCLSLYNKGFLNVYLPQVEVYHYESASRRHPFSDKENYQKHLTESNLMLQKWRNIFNTNKVLA